LQAIERARAAARSRLRLISSLRSSFAVCVATALLAAPCAALARTQTPAQPQTQPPQTQTQAPTQNPAQPTQTPAQTTQPPAPAPTQPQTPATLPQSPATQPQTPGTQPQPPAAGTTLPAQPQAAPTTPQGQTQTPAGVQQTPGQSVGIAPGVLPAELPSEPPPVAPNFEAPMRPLPSAERVGVDIANQLSLSLNDAIALALRNNNDIDGSRINVEIAEYGLRAARGVY